MVDRVDEAIERMRAEGTAAAGVDLVLGGNLTTEELQRLRGALLIDHRLVNLAQALNVYRDLKSVHKSSAKRAAIVAERFNLTPATVGLYITCQKDSRVVALADRLRAQTSYKN